MSNRAVKWAFETDVPGTLKLVLVALAHCHNGKTGQCNPRIETLAGMVGRSIRPVQYALKELETLGYIHRARRRKGARQASNHYVLALDGVVFQGAKNSRLKGQEKCRKQHPESAENSTLYIEQELEQESERPTNVVNVEFGNHESSGRDKVRDEPQVEPSCSAENSHNRKRPG